MLGVCGGGWRGKRRGSEKVRAVAVYSLDEYVSSFGSEILDFTIAHYSCPLNEHVEDFLKNKAIQSFVLGASVTYLVIDKETDDLLGYFTLLLKPFKVPSVGLSSRNTRLISRFAELDEDGKSYTAALYLIAQLGKNFAVSEDSRISGAELMEYAMQKLQSARRFVGGKLVLVDREIDRPKLLKFYQQFNFRSWNVRHSKKDGIDYDQMLCVLNAPASGRAA